MPELEDLQGPDFLLLLQGVGALADSITTQVMNVENGGTVLDCLSTTSCGASQATGSLSAGTMGAVAQISSAEPNLPGGVSSWQSVATAELNYSNTVDVPSGAGSIALSAGSVVFTVTVSGTETYSGSGGTAYGVLSIASNESFVGGVIDGSVVGPWTGSSTGMPAGTSIVEISTPVSAGNSTLDFSVSATAICPGFTAAQIAAGSSCTATAEFLDPVTITEAVVLASDGTPIPDAAIVSQSGFSPPAAIPEPATPVLMGVGLLSIIAGMRRRASV